MADTVPPAPPPSSSPAPSGKPARRTTLVLDGVPKRGLLKRLLLFAVFMAILGVNLGLVVAGAIYVKFSQGLPSLPSAKDYRPPVVGEFWSDDRALVGEFFDERRKVIPYERIPKKLVQAFVAAEDSRFFDHPGIDAIGTGRAAIKTYVLRNKVQGGSTLTQQAAKAVLISVELSKITEEDLRAEVKRRLKPRGLENDADAIRVESLKVHAKMMTEAHARATEKTLRRKIRELILALRLEKALTKEEILYLYLNNVYLGHHSYGVESAAENYYRKDVRDLTLGETALLAGLPKEPSGYSPFIHPEAARTRRHYVLTRMKEEGMISAEEFRTANAEPVKVFAVEDPFHEVAPFFTEHVRRDIVNRYGNERLLKDGLKVYVTMNLEKQRAAQVAMLDGLIRVDKRQGYVGPLSHLGSESEKADFEKKIARKLGSEKLTEGQFYVGYVEKIDEAGNFALVNVGGQQGKLSIMGMRWAREPNPEKYFPNVLIDHVKKALKVGDVIIFKGVKREDLEDKDDKLSKVIPKEGPFFTLEQEPTLQGAVVSQDPSRAYVVAMIGGYDFDASEYNRAFQACRQPGSSFKPIVYSAAIEQLEWTVNKVLVDSPVVTDSDDTGVRWKPENYDETFHGEVLVRTALINSMNIPAIKTLQAVGVKQASDWAHKLGITTAVNLDLAMALGGSCVHLWDMVNVYATINQSGRKIRSTFVRKVEDRFGRTLEDHTAYDDEFANFDERVLAGYAKLFDKPEQVMKPETAFLITHLMREVVLYGTGAPAQKLGKPVAGKTGTTNDAFDTWFMGFTKDLVTGVWLGYDHNEHPLGKYETGGRASLPIWLDYMGKALGERPQPEFKPPEDIDIVWVKIDPDTGKLAAPGQKGAVLAPFIRGTEPKEQELDKKQVDPRDVMMHDLP